MTLAMKDRTLAGALTIVAMLAAAPASAQQGPAPVMPTGIVKLNPNGPDGQGLRPSRNGSSQSHTYYSGKTADRGQVGVWASDAPGGNLHKATYTEFVYLLEGSVTLVDKAGVEAVYKAGDAFVIPRGTEVQWKKSDKLKEVYVIFDRESPDAPAVQGTPSFFKLEKDGPAGKGLVGKGRTKEHEYFSGPNHSSIGVWETAAHSAADFGRETRYAELMVILSGTVTLSTPQGQSETFTAGEVALVPAGVRYKWSSDTVRKYWVIFDNTAPPTASR